MKEIEYTPNQEARRALIVAQFKADGTDEAYAVDNARKALKYKQKKSIYNIITFGIKDKAALRCINNGYVSLAVDLKAIKD